MQPTSSSAVSKTRDSTIATAYELLKAGRVDDAEKLCQGLLALTPNIKTAVLASTIAEERDDLPRALQIVDAAIEHHGVSAELLLPLTTRPLTSSAGQVMNQPNMLVDRPCWSAMWPTA